MKLSELIKSIDTIKTIGNVDIDITGICYDSRKIKLGNIFIAVPGYVNDGSFFIPRAVKDGAAAAVFEKDSKESYNATRILVKDARIAMAELSNKFYDYPSRKIKFIGVTGTNGKTTTTFIIESILSRAGNKVGLIGTVGAHIAKKLINPTLTTPESADLQRILADMVGKGCRHVVAEVSSHSIALERIKGCEFDVAVYTNITHDHLDFHKNMENYLKTKLRLFEDLGSYSKKSVWAVINRDDNYADIFIKNSNSRTVTYGLKSNSDFFPKNLKSDISSMNFQISNGLHKFKVKTKLIGVYNVYNILAAASACSVLGVSEKNIIDGIEEMETVPGRLERIVCGQKFNVFVDFAHSPDGLEQLLDTLRKLTKKRLILLFGCTGNRDRLKRPLMGEIAAYKSNFAIITTDDPHSEDPETIIDEVEVGVKRGGWKIGKNYLKITDRKDAIKKVLDIAGAGDCVVLAGRGHETYQDFNGKKVEIDDRCFAKSILGGGCK